jgi:hypothetical protein
MGGCTFSTAGGGESGAVWDSCSPSWDSIGRWAGAVKISYLALSAAPEASAPKRICVPNCVQTGHNSAGQGTSQQILPLA